ncbi:hypothetical protein GWK47_041544 [Chionoecetes opilio]|uniref:Uncharacterized protein n=1 Tax=Chionoecetes opilio TaxID=41210 RepID=A0A8J5CX54_CHIOP|nr:hypothetical protein GWK47_041544 [Chionoecetes opilio]
MKCFLKNKHENCNISRWWCRAISCENTLLRLECIVRLLKETSADDTGSRAVSARGILAQINAEFVYLLHFFSEILGKIHIVPQQLQDKQADLGKAVKLISSLSEDLADMRNSNLIEQYSEKVTELCKKCCISPLRIEVGEENLDNLMNSSCWKQPVKDMTQVTCSTAASCMKY